MENAKTNSNDLNELSNILFDTLRGVVSKEVPAEQAKVISNMGNTIIANAKVQLEAYRQTKGGFKPSFIALDESETKPVLLPKTSEQFKFTITPGLKEYVQFKKYLSIEEAMVVEGKEQLILNAEAWIIEKSKVK